MIYSFNQLDDFIELFNDLNIVHKNGTKKYYYNVSCSFDIETSSFYIDDKNNITTDKLNGRKCSNMYIWQFAINDNVIYSRFWIDFLRLIEKLENKLNTSENLRLIIYVHNLSYEFQYIYKMFNWSSVFAITERKPIYALNKNGIEFRCSYILSGYNLDTLAKNLENKTVKKLVGNLDYNLIRHNKTELTEKELEYCFNDVLIVTQYINEQIKEFGTIANIPLTQTGKVRNFTKNKCFSIPEYKYFIKELTLDVLEYQKLNMCYSGGFTHSNAINTNIKLENVSSYDFTSSYPFVMLSEKYPMSKGRKIKITSQKMFLDCLNNYCCLFSIRLFNVKPKTMNENILQASKCYNTKKAIINNGRIVECEQTETILNEIDFYNITQFYHYDNFEVDDFYIYEKNYLPKPIIESILELYGKKTTLKNVSGKEKEYLHSKEMLNSIYGMCVTNTMKQQIIFNSGVWGKDSDFNLNESVENYNKDRNRFLFYPWGVWVTSYARKNLFNGILNMGNDYIYSDTDSLKILNREKHLDYFENYNKQVEIKLKNMCEYYNIDFNLCKPKTIKGVEKLIGVWDFEETYKHFKTLGAKRYLIENDSGNYEITIAGLPKNAISYIIKYAEENKKDVFDVFSNYMYIPENETGKKTHTYIDNENIVNITDYKGKTIKVLCKSGVHLENCEFTLLMGDVYIDYLFNYNKIIEMK